MKPIEKKLVIVAVIAAVVLSISPYFPIIKNKLFPENKFPSAKNTIIDKKINTIKQVMFDGCDIVVRDESGVNHKIGELGDGSAKCGMPSKYIVSDSGKYLMFADVMGGVDLWIRIFSTETGVINTFDVWGTSALLDMEFLPNDKVVTLNGYRGTLDEQYLSLYDIPALYQDYENNLIELSGYLRVNKYKTALQLKPVKSEHGDIVRIGNTLTVYGGTVEKPVLRAEYSISKL